MGDKLKNSYWIKLKDKNGTPFQIGHPEAFLSQRVIDRRIRQHITIDETDLPVSAVYLDSLKNRGLEVVHTSKWLNGTTIRTSETILLKNLTNLPVGVLILSIRSGVKEEHFKLIKTTN